MKQIIGMIHVEALPGTPKNKYGMGYIVNKALDEAFVYARNGVHMLMIENMHDVPYTKVIRPEVTAAMSIVGMTVKKAALPVGIQILAGGNREALAVAKAAGLDFIRAEGYVFGHIGDEGYFDSCAGELLRYRKSLGADNVKVYTDIKKKHSSHALTNDVSLEETARAAKFFLSDGVIITGSSTGKEPSLSDLAEVQELEMPILIGSGITAQNLEKYWNFADSFIVGSYVKKDGNWQNEIDEKRVRTLMEKYKRLQYENK